MRTGSLASWIAPRLLTTRIVDGWPKRAFTTATILPILNPRAPIRSPALMKDVLFLETLDVAVALAKRRSAATIRIAAPRLGTNCVWNSALPGTTVVEALPAARPQPPEVVRVVHVKTVFVP